MKQILLPSPRTISSRGSAAVELAAFMPFIAAFIIICVQFANLFLSNLDALSKAAVDAERAIVMQGIEHGRKGFKRPCLAGKRRFTVRNRPVTIGLGNLKREINVEQSVTIAEGDICAD